MSRKRDLKESGREGIGEIRSDPEEKYATKHLLERLWFHLLRLLYHWLCLLWHGDDDHHGQDVADTTQYGWNVTSNVGGCETTHNYTDDVTSSAHRCHLSHLCCLSLVCYICVMLI